MKRILYFSLVAMMAFSACNKQETIENQSNKSTVLKASAEDAITKATLNNATITWSEGDNIGVYVSNNANTWNTNAEFTLKSGQGTTQGVFQCATDYSNGNHWDVGAFFPYQGDGSDKNNIWNGNMYFKLPAYYHAYTSGKFELPLIADLSGENPQPEEISFKHVGGAVVVIINNLAPNASSIGMTVEGAKIHGNDFAGILLSNAGTDNGCLVGSASSTNNTIWLDFDQSDNYRSFTFVFPVPTLSAPKLTFELYGQNVWSNQGVLLWKKSTKAQPNIGRGEMLAMPATNIEYYSHLKTNSDYGVCASINNWGEGTPDIAMITDGTWHIARNVSLPANSQFRVRKDNKWDKAYPSGNFVVPDEGVYDIVFNSDDESVTIVKAVN